MPRDILSDSLAVLRIVEHEDEENWPLEDKVPCKKVANSNSKENSQKYPKDDCACYYNYALGDSSANRQNDPIYQYKTSSLPAASSINQTWDEIVCSPLRIAPEDIANQLSLLDLQCFKSIRPEELSTCGWTKANKLTVAPNVVAFTKRFNRVSFWTVQEILNGQTPKARAETLAHFIKVAKKLYDLNNLHSLFAVISALHSASIYRLSKTWACLSKKDKQQFDKLAELFGEKDNWTALREYMRSISLPCIPYLGIFLTDLVYIDMAHPAGSPHRVAKMAVVLKALERYQTSEYDILPVPHVAVYLNSVRYIEELQKFLEDDQYKLSLKLEPPSPIGSCAGSKESVKEVSVLGTCTSYSLSPSHRLGSGSLRLQGTYTQTKFIPTHRKCRSLGSNDVLSAMDSVECDFQSYVRRKTIIKDGRKISLSSWQRYWLQMSANILIFYGSKTFKGTSRNDFSKERCKVLALHDGWRAVWLQTDASDAFQMIDHHCGTVYKFKTGSEATAKQWAAKINEVTNKMVKPLPANLMSFE
ncbi:ras-specific guanine nucleotide-releasing factor RalGPS1 isoform X5 [Pararge aegeria]|uniref:ras-specific guanine nucleotide-releasing factor RalGPS1 isoform X5 n=1 Tax=Pararge aegeria TaxID=116150 RepID=UPI0019D0C5A2|nr:ras-specific guanine nucleotide-releasing factor RalGPS1 isoform X5 [Pararge aegeria]